MEFIEPVRQATGLADVHFVPTVAIDVTNSDSVVPVDIDARGGIDARPPVRDSAQHLLAELIVSAEQLRGYVAEERLAGLDQRLLNRVELYEAAIFPRLLPQPHPILEALRPGAFDFVADDVVRQHEIAGASNCAERSEPLPQALFE